jgi:hypothetical protein
VDLVPGGPDEEICPYATFHLLGFREEMDPSKNASSTLPHPPGHGHHRGGSQSAVIYRDFIIFIFFKIYFNVELFSL